MFVKERIQMRPIAAAKRKRFTTVRDYTIFASGPDMEFLHLIYVDNGRAVDTYKTARVELRLHPIHRFA